jgi:PHD/YefM family antitoxin component YafN of YafNO toxin-antitoxin module
MTQEDTMIITSDAIVSNSEMIKNYKGCRDMAEKLGKLFVLKHNSLDAVLLSIKEYERISALLEYVENLDTEAIQELVEALPVTSTKIRNSRETF